MFPASRDQFEKFLIHSCTSSFFLEVWQEDRLIAVSTCDYLDDGISAVYTFFLTQTKVVAHSEHLRY